MERATRRHALVRAVLGGISALVLTTVIGAVPVAPANAATAGPEPAAGGMAEADGAAVPDGAARADGAAPAAVTAAAPRGACSDAYQIGSTGYIYYRGAVAASVKQFYSPACVKNYGYVWVWESFRALGIPYDVGVAVYSYTNGQQYGNVYTTATRKAAFWSAPANTVQHCTAGFGTMLINNTTPADGYSSKRCY